MPVTVVVESLIYGSTPARYKVSGDGGFEAATAAEVFYDDKVPDKNGNGQGGVELGRGKRQRKSNRLYDSKQFWHHYDDENSSEEGDI